MTNEDRRESSQYMKRSSTYSNYFQILKIAKNSYISSLKKRSCEDSNKNTTKSLGGNIPSDKELFNVYIEKMVFPIILTKDYNNKKTIFNSIFSSFVVFECNGRFYSSEVSINESIPHFVNVGDLFLEAISMKDPININVHCSIKSNNKMTSLLNKIKKQEENPSQQPSINLYNELFNRLFNTRITVQQLMSESVKANITYVQVKFVKSTIASMIETWNLIQLTLSIYPLNIQWMGFGKLVEIINIEGSYHSGFLEINNKSLYMYAENDKLYLEPIKLFDLSTEFSIEIVDGDIYNRVKYQQDSRKNKGGSIVKSLSFSGSSIYVNKQAIMANMGSKEGSCVFSRKNHWNTDKFKNPSIDSFYSSIEQESEITSEMSPKLSSIDEVTSRGKEKNGIMKKKSESVFCRDEGINRSQRINIIDPKLTSFDQTTGQTLNNQVNLENLNHAYREYIFNRDTDSFCIYDKIDLSNKSQDNIDKENSSDSKRKKKYGNVDDAEDIINDLQIIDRPSKQNRAHILNNSSNRLNQLTKIESSENIINEPKQSKNIINETSYGKIEIDKRLSSNNSINETPPSQNSIFETPPSKNSIDDMEHRDSNGSSRNNANCQDNSIQNTEGLKRKIKKTRKKSTTITTSSLNHYLALYNEDERIFIEFKDGNSTSQFIEAINKFNNYKQKLGHFFGEKEIWQRTVKSALNDIMGDPYEVFNNVTNFVKKV